MMTFPFLGKNLLILMKIDHIVLSFLLVTLLLHGSSCIELNSAKVNEDYATSSKLEEKSFSQSDLKITQVDLLTAAGLSFDSMKDYFTQFSLRGFAETFVTLTLSGFGDKSFLVMIVASMSFNKLTVTIASFFALSLMGLVSIVLGVEVVKFLPGYAINLISISLFLVMGIRMMLEGLDLPEEETEKKGEHKFQEDSYLAISVCEDQVSNTNIEVGECEKIFLDNKSNISFIEKCGEPYNTDVPQDIIDDHQYLAYKLELKYGKTIPQFNNFLYEFCQIFMLVFLGELGDKSQVSTIYMANQTTVFTVLIAVITSNVVISILCVLFGKLISDRLSLKSIYIYAGGAFVMFGMIALFCSMQQDFSIFDYRLNGSIAN